MAEIKHKINESFSSFKDFDGLMHEVDSKVNQQNMELKNVSEEVLTIRTESEELALSLKNITNQQEGAKQKLSLIKGMEDAISTEIEGIYQDILENNKLLLELDKRTN
ncbi:hypothetical protein BCI9360_04111 [Bacillus sp. CECT 9360]|nr:hypothetical protein BCI9360_04111 [Bacillus sp. CECT 9360]